MRRGTTPAVVITVTNKDGTDCDLTGHEVHVTFKERAMNGFELTKRETDEGVEIEHDDPKSIITVVLTQAETLKFKAGRKVAIQIRCKALGVAKATDIAVVDAEGILKDGEI